MVDQFYAQAWQEARGAVLGPPARERPKSVFASSAVAHTRTNSPQDRIRWIGAAVEAVELLGCLNIVCVASKIVNYIWQAGEDRDVGSISNACADAQRLPVQNCASL